ncbi:MAG: HEPN domain-containing protein [Candidatus Pacebacteria bacterium]|nr:HEPN domain-containing protein [Candidatus Paceibacterota bacterium]
MKTSLEHLPEEKREELEALVRITLDNFPKWIEMIILFGSYARGDWVEELALDKFHYTYQSDFDILVVISKKVLGKRHRAWEHLEDRFHRSPGVRTPVTLLYEHIDYINAQLSEGQYFFSDIKKEGILLYDSGNYQLAEARELTPKENKKIAQEYFEQWFESAEGFFDMYQYALNKNQLKISAFQLHQAVERFYSTILLVFTQYRPKIHDIEKLGHQAAGHEPKLLNVFPRGTAEEERLFELLRKAYVDARYKRNYTITREELEWLAERVEMLQELTEKVCKRKIESFTKNAVL